MSKGRRHLSHLQRRPGFANDYEKAQEATKLPQDMVEADIVRGDPEKGKRFRKEGPLVTRRPSIDPGLNAGSNISAIELSRLEQAALTRPLTEEELRKYRIYMEMHLKSAREDREKRKQEIDELEKASLDELAEEARRILEE